MPGISWWPVLTWSGECYSFPREAGFKSKRVEMGSDGFHQRRGRRWQVGWPWRKVRFAKKRSSHTLQYPLLGKEPLHTWVHEGRKKLLCWHFCGWLGSSRSSWPLTDCVLGPADLFPRAPYLLNLSRLWQKALEPCLWAFPLTWQLPFTRLLQSKPVTKKRERDWGREKEREREPHIFYHRTSQSLPISSALFCRLDVRT